MANSDRCTVIMLETEDLYRSVQKPELASLIRDGWGVISTSIVEEKGQTKFAVILGPPKARGAHIQSAYQYWIHMGLLAVVAGLLASMAMG